MSKTKTPKTTTKAVPFRLIVPRSDEGRPIYDCLHELVEAHHQDIMGARIVLAWHVGWHHDEDGRLILGKCQRASDLEREIADAQAYDFVILLNYHFWTDPIVTDLQRRALLDHELCHAAVKTGDNGAPVIDERGRITYRLRKHDLEEFSAIGERYGCWKRDIEGFMTAVAKARMTSDEWIGAQRLRVDLIAVGVPVSLEAIYTWSAAERREASVWARAFRSVEAATPIEHSCPPHVLAALTTVEHAGPPS